MTKSDSTIKEIFICERCGPFEPDSYTCEKLNCHAVPYIDSDGDMQPEQCGPITKYVPASEVQRLRDALESIAEYWNGGSESAVDAIEEATAIAQAALKGES